MERPLSERIYVVEAGEQRSFDWEAGVLDWAALSSVLEPGNYAASRAERSSA
jgi:hypothetical protein